MAASKGAEAAAAVGDIGDPENSKRAVSLALERWRRLYIVVNNAGIFTPTTLEDVGMAVFDRMQYVMVEGTFPL